MMKSKPVTVTGFKILFLQSALCILLVLLFMESLPFVDGKLSAQMDNKVDKVQRYQESDRSAGAKRRLLNMRNKNGSESSLQLTMSQLQFVISHRRNFNAFILVINDWRKCSDCQIAEETIDLLARLYIKSDYFLEESERGITFFLKVKIVPGEYEDFLDLELTQPNLFYFKTTRSLEGDNVARLHVGQMTQSIGHFSSVNFIQWIQHHSGFRLVRLKDPPPQRISLSTICVFTFAGGLALFWIYRFGYWEVITEAVANINYSYSIMVTVLWLLSGHMYNYMRNTPMLGNRNFPESIIYPGYGYQYGAESIVILLLYGLIIFSIIRLIKLREYQLGITTVQPLYETPPTTKGEQEQEMLKGSAGFFFGFVVLLMIKQFKS